MQTMFDYFTSTFGFVTGLFAAIFGMAFPLLLQSIQRIDEKYDSSVVSKEFYGDVRYKLFTRMLYPYVVLVCISPLVLGYVSDSPGISYAIQTFMLIYILLLSVVLMFLYKRITQFYSLDKLVELHNDNKTDDAVLFYYDLAKYSVRKGYQDSYIKAMSKVADCYYKERMSASENTEVTYSNNLQRVLREIGNEIGKEPEAGIEYKFSDITAILLDSSDKTFLSDNTYSLLWYMLNKAVKANNHQWLSSYWTFASQYCRTKKNNVEQGPYNPHIKRLVEFNVMFGALLANNEKYDFLNHITTFTQSKPESFPLIPSNLGHILEITVDFECLLQSFLVMESRYTMVGVDKGVNTDAYLVNIAYQYLALLIIRLWYRKHARLDNSYIDPLTLPAPDNSSIDKNNIYIQATTRLKSHISDWYDQDVESKLSYTPLRPAAGLLEILDNFINACSRKIEEIDNRKGFDEDKLKVIYDDAVCHNARIQLEIPTQQELPKKENSKKVDFEVEGTNSIERRFLQKGTAAQLGNVGEGLSMDLHLKARQAYMDIVFGAFNLTRITVPGRDLSTKLHELGLSTDYCILDISGGIQYDTALPVYHLGRLYDIQMLFICKKAGLPSLDIIDTMPADRKLIDQFNYLYGFIHEEPDHFDISIMQKYQSVVLNTKGIAFEIVIN